MGGASYDSSGHGIDANVSFNGTTFQYYVGFSYYQTEDLAPLSKAVDHGFYAYSSVTYKPAAALPDIIVDGGLGQYGYRGLHDLNYDGTYWSAALGMDFSKFLWDSADTKLANLGKTALAGLPSLKVFYRYTGERFDLSSETHPDDHLFGVMLRIGPAQSVLPRLGRLQWKN